MNNIKKVLLVGGTFLDTCGKQSSLFEKISTSIMVSGLFNITYLNGGSLDRLQSIRFENFDIVLWAANVANTVPKDVIKNIKTVNPKCLLISTKRNHENEYDTLDIINHALNIKSNLVLEFKISDTNPIIGMRLLDPLGNCFYDGNDTIQLANAMIKRITQLLTYTRMKSISITNNMVEVEPPAAYIEIIRKHGDTFKHFLVGNAGGSTRFLGNTSFRCINGFPSMRSSEDIILVSKRNLDKSTIDKDSFVPVLLRTDGDNSIYYQGIHKPSVDAPIQVMLYRHFNNINYMLHSHVYVKDASFVGYERIPCGCLKEIDDIKGIINKDALFFKVNLRGHGCIIAGNGYSQLDNIEFYPREIPEF